MRTLNGEPTPSTVEWERLRPLVDDVILELNARDRSLVLLRFFEGRPFAEIGAAWNMSTDAARMRLDRALEKMRRLLAKRGVTSTGAALAAVLAEQSALAAPSGLAASVTSVALGAGGAAATAGVLGFMSTTKILTAFAVVLGLVSFVPALREASALGEAERRLAAEEDGHRSAAARLHELQVREVAARQEIALLRQSLEDARTAKPADDPRSSRSSPAPANDAGRDPLVAGAAFLAAHPEVKQVLVDRSRARVDSRYYTLFAELHLSREQISRFEDLLIEREGLNLNYPETGPLALRPGKGLTRDQVEEGVRELLGDDGYRRYQETGRAAAAQFLTSTLASALYFTDTPLTGQQADDLAQVVLRPEVGRRNDGGVRDWDALIGQAKSVLSPSQLAALDNLRAQDEFAAAMKRLTGK